MSNQTIETKTGKSKFDLECQKLVLEIEQMQKPWWKKPGSLAIIATLVAALTTAGVQLSTHYLSSKREEKEKTEKIANVVKTVGTSQEFLTEREKSKREEKKELRRRLLESVKD